VTELLQVEQLCMRFGGLLAVDTVCFTAQRGAITALIGPNGAGKTTVFNCLTGFYRPTSGAVTLHQADGGKQALHTLPDYKIARHGVARTFQNIRLFPDMTVLENLLVAQHRALSKAARLWGGKRYRHAEDDAIALASAWLRKADLLGKANGQVANLPYGEQRKVEILRALCTNPTLLCLDEPAAGLNPKESQELTQFLRSLREEEGISLLLIEHDMGVVMGLADHIVVLEYGRKIAEGSAEVIRQHPEVIRAYLGEEGESEC
jgi:branched-chain amino acid transport system ATP-binding protein